MADVALKAGIAWKKALVEARLKYVEEKDPDNKTLIQRYKHELDVLKTPNRASYDLVKRNLDGQLQSEKESLAAYEGYVAHKEIISKEDSETMAALRRVIAEIEKLRADLEKEGRPPA